MVETITYPSFIKATRKPNTIKVKKDIDSDWLEKNYRYYKYFTERKYLLSLKIFGWKYNLFGHYEYVTKRRTNKELKSIKKELKEILFKKYF